ncbi:hypothetical protein [Lentilactobacillus farraginis]|nr:hypothetical protein [Lentilactobacillus farraginis]
MGAIFNIGDFIFVVITWIIIIALVVMLIHFGKIAYKALIKKQKNNH